jgi:sulfate adenylyltransferase subunit 1
MNIIRVSTAGSVDDGKSTFIGRLLYDTNSLPKDKINQIRSASEKKGMVELDLSLVTDGLIAEREQGITIDVAHIYFSTPHRKYILADSPGHIEYTRNMVTGASNSDVFIILVDARHGIVEQTKRHLFIAKLMEIKEIIVVINKMDLVKFSESRYHEILTEMSELQIKFELEDRRIKSFPVSAKLGDNVVNPSKNMDWYKGRTVLNYLEKFSPDLNREQAMRFSVQYVIRPNSDEFHDFRGFAGKVLSGTLAIGDEIIVQSTGQSAKILHINRYKDKLLTASSGDAIVIELDKAIGVSRGDLFTHKNEIISSEKIINSNLCWLNNTPLNLNQRYLFKQGPFVTQITITKVDSQFDFEQLSYLPQPTSIGANSISKVQIQAASALFIDSFEKISANGAFVLIDPLSNATVAVGFKS